MSRSLAKLAMLVACLGLFACGGDPEGTGGSGGTIPGTGGTGADGGSGGDGGTGGTGGTPCVCGDAIKCGEEACDDGNSDNTDNCLDDCSLARCGDGFLREGIEQCDDGDENSDELAGACRTNCALPYCGDNVIDAGETCDDGNFADNDDCRSDCTPTVCGDGKVDAHKGEECDDGNQVNNDACSNSCHNAMCGDGIVGPGETCDDGDFSNSNSCTDTCVPNVCGDGHLWEDREACDDGNKENDDGCRNDCSTPDCGDGRVDPGEDCDDANEDDTDACLGTCLWARCGDGQVRVGPGGVVLEQCDWAATNAPTNCRSPTNTSAGNLACTLAECGDGVNDFGDVCDDGNDIETDSCRNDCSLSRCGDGVVWAGQEECDLGDGNNSDTLADTCRTDCDLPTCGDGVTDAGEQCDDGNRTDGDGCTNACRVAGCGDGIVQAGVEECDDGTNNSDTVANACRTNCALPDCGDSVVDNGEACDNGANNTAVGGDPATDCRTVTCQRPGCGDGVVDTGEVCDLGAANTAGPSDPATGCRLTCVRPTCHDNVVDAGEACDDGNTANTDACVGTCVAATCGDSYVQAGVEQCDNGANNSNTAVDGCRTPSCQNAFCGDGITDTAESCDDANTNNADGCLSSCARPLTVSFNGFDTVRADTRTRVAITGGLDSTFDGTAMVQWKLTVTDGSGNPVTGALAYYRDAAIDADVHEVWTNFITTDVNGVATFGPTTGFPASNLQVTGGLTTPFSVLFDNAGAHNLRVELINVGTSAVIGSATQSFTVGAFQMSVALAGFDTLDARYRGPVTVTGVLDAAYSATANVKWRFTVTDGSNAAVAGMRFYFDDTNPTGDVNDWTNAIVTDASGQATYGGASGFAVNSTTLQTTGGQSWRFGALFRDAGNYHVRAELVDAATNAVVGGNAVRFTVDTQTLTVAFNGYDSINAVNRGLVSLTAALDSTYTSTNNVLWTLTLTDASGAPVVGARAYYDDTGTIADHTQWTTYIVTDTNGQANWGPSTGFPASVLQASGGVTSSFSVDYSTVGSGDYHLWVQLDDLTAGTVVGYDEKSYNVRATTMSFSSSWTTLQANVRGSVNYRARLDPTWSSSNLSWRITVLNGTSAASGVTLYSYNPAGANDDTFDHLTWSTAITTNSSGVAQSATFNATTLQGTSPTTVAYSASFPTSGTYTVQVELLDGTVVVDSHTTTATVN